MRNLIANAIKFSHPESEIYINAQKEVNLGYEYIRISVIDKGIGISPEDLEKLFNPESHFSSYGTSNEKGSGLGLKICKEFIEINKGEISVESNPGEGSVFSFTLPVEKPEG
ncbi:MAG: hypothetical protein HC906_10180 [Bacteroidales bacterium]|nr:hypothetical protein [Bacteroidales bacterium]